MIALRCTSYCEDREEAEMEEWTDGYKTKRARGHKQDRALIAGRQDYEICYEAKKTGRSSRKLPVRLSITHNFWPDEGTQPDVGET